MYLSTYISFGPYSRNVVFGSIHRRSRRQIVSVFRVFKTSSCRRVYAIPSESTTKYSRPYDYNIIIVPKKQRGSVRILPTDRRANSARSVTAVVSLIFIIRVQTETRRLSLFGFIVFRFFLRIFFLFEY